LQVYVNGDSHELPETTSLAQLVEQLELVPQRIAIELNRVVVRRADWSTTTLRDGDRLEIVHFVGGGCETELILI
jgi:thiamine biosynthesis protein ThiS